MLGPWLGDALGAQSDQAGLAGLPPDLGGLSRAWRRAAGRACTQRRARIVLSGISASGKVGRSFSRPLRRQGRTTSAASLLLQARTNMLYRTPHHRRCRIVAPTHAENHLYRL